MKTNEFTFGIVVAIAAVGFVFGGLVGNITAEPQTKIVYIPPCYSICKPVLAPCNPALVSCEWEGIK